MEASSSEDYQATIKSLQEFLEMVPNSAEAHFNIGAAYEKMGDTENALASYRKAVEFAPDMYDAWLAMGDLCGKTQKWQEGMEALGKALELQPDTGAVLFNYGAYAFNAGDVDAAEGAFERLVEADPTHAMGHYRLALVNVGQGDREKAIAHIEKYLELAPDSPNAAAAKELLNTLNQQS
jgi:tetratricopeptide (TPR) repeat protein